MVVVARGEFTVSTLYDGVDGVADKFFRAWADSANGATDFSKTDSNRSYLGTFVGLTEPTSYTQYSWSKLTGEPGKDSVVVVLSNDSHTIPANSVGTGTNFTGAETQVRVYQGAQDVTASWVLSATVSTGLTGSFTAQVYKVTGLTTDQGYVDIKATKGTDVLTKRFTITKAKSGYTPVKGVDYFDGAEGTSSYIWVRYSKSADGSSMTTNPTGTSYIGTTTTNTTTPPTLPSAYQWVKFVGEQGIGVPGEPGKSSYLHLKYSNDGGKTFTANNGETFGDYIGKLVNNTATDSLVPSAYQWGKIAGEDATNYKLLISPKLVKKDKLGVLDATSFTATGKSQTGVGAFTNYAGRFTIEEDKGTGLVLKYTSVGNELSKAYAISADTRSIRVRLYLAGGTNTILDEETLTVVSDGATGVDAVLLTVSTPDGDVIRNSLGNLRATAELYQGIKTVTATAYQWYARNPAGAGDADSGVGWNKLTTGTAGGTTGFTTKTLTITPSAIAGSATFMVIVTYAGIKLRREVTVQDITDTYTFATVGNGNFKNGQGSNIFTQKVYQDGVEVDVAGTKFQYQWNLYNNDGTMNTTFVKVGKTITLLASEYVGKGFLYCTVSG